jgi:hypothetical protein
MAKLLRLALERPDLFTKPARRVQLAIGSGRPAPAARYR